MEKDKILLDLPVLPHDRDSAVSESVVHDSYLKEIEAVKTGADMTRHVERWRNLWLLRDEERPALTPGELRLVRLEFSPDAVAGHALRKKDAGLDFEDPDVQVMMNVVAPISLVMASMLAQQYGVGSDLILVRMFLDPYPEHEDACRNGSGDTRLKKVDQVMDR